MSGIKDQITNFFAAMEKGQLIGVDIGLSAVKLAVMAKHKKSFRLDAFATVPLSEAAIIDDEVQKPEEIISAIADCYNDLDIKAKIACVGISGSNTMTKRLQVANGTAEEVEDNVLWESEQYISFDVDSSVIDYSIVRDLKDQDAKDVLVVAARSDVAENYSNYVKEAGLFPKIVDLRSLAITNLFEYAYADRIDDLSSKGSIILDFGAQKTTIIVYKNEGPILTREIDFGGVLVTEEIQRQMGLSYVEAEDLKTHGDENGNVPEEIIGVIDSQLATAMEDLKKILNFYIAAGSSEQAGYCFITGGTALLPGLTEALEDIVGLEIEFLNPFENISYNTKKISEEDISSIASMGVVSMGLGLRKI